MNTNCVYLFHNQQTGEAYIGSSKDGEVRMKSHLRFLEANSHPNYRFQRAWNRNPNFDFVAVPTETRDEAFDLEQVIIDEFRGNRLFLNISQDARAVVIEHREDSKEKIGQAKAKQWQDPQYRDKVIKAQHAGRAALSAEEIAAAGQKKSVGLKQAYAEGKRTSNAGQTRSEEFRQNNSRNISELWKDPAYRARQMEARSRNRKESQ